MHGLSYSPPIILPWRGIMPKIHETAFIAPGAVIIGDVEIGEGASIWFGVVIRGDVNYIRIGKRTNVQDGTIIHVTREIAPTIIGDEVTIGHQVTLHGCTVKDHGFVGMNSCILDHAVIESNAMLAAGALLTPGKTIKSGELWAGSPAKLMRPLKPEESEDISASAARYANWAAEYRADMKNWQ